MFHRRAPTEQKPKMATPSYLSPLSKSFSPISFARPNSHNTKNNPSNKSLPKAKRLPSKLHNPKPRNATTPTSGGDATTFTRLPPKDDFFLAPFNSSPAPPNEIRLSDSTIGDRLYQKPVNKKVDTRSDELGGEDDKLGAGYGKFELFEINSDSDYEFDDDDDDNDEEMTVFDESREVFDGEGLEEREEKEKGKDKGVPAVMRCFDQAKIYVKAGDGGNGVVAFRREKYVPMGGPSGGDGGRGGNVYAEVNGSMNSLLPFRQCVHFRAGRGGHGHGRKQNGAKGEDVVVKVPPGTVIREASVDGEQGEVLLELLQAGQRALLLPGGRGGRGNASFKSGVNKVPKIAENGEEGLEM